MSGTSCLGTALARNVIFILPANALQQRAVVGLHTSVWYQQTLVITRKKLIVKTLYAAFMPQTCIEAMLVSGFIMHAGLSLLYCHWWDAPRQRYYLRPSECPFSCLP